jgi:serine/threonine-protein kinase PknK
MGDVASREMSTSVRTLAVLLALAAAAGCGSSGPSTSSRRSTTTNPTTTPTTTRTAAAPTRTRPARAVPIRLRVAGALAPLPSARSGIAAATFGSSIVIAGGLDQAGVSTASVFTIDERPSAAIARLPGPIHDAAAAQLGGRLLVFGGGQSKGSDRIIAALPGPPRQIGRLPQALSDLDAVAIGAVAYVVGGWNGTDTNRDIYAIRPSAQVNVAAMLPVGVRYPVAAALGGRVIVAGGETASGAPTAAAWSFDPPTGRIARLPGLPVPTDHTAGAALGGRVYVLGGLRNGAFTDAIVSWAPGEHRWRPAGHLPEPLADEGAVPFAGGIAVVGGRGPSGKLATVTLLRRG